MTYQGINLPTLTNIESVRKDALGAELQIQLMSGVANYFLAARSNDHLYACDTQRLSESAPDARAAARYQCDLIRQWFGSHSIRTKPLSDQVALVTGGGTGIGRSEEHTSELQPHLN